MRNGKFSLMSRYLTRSMLLKPATMIYMIRSLCIGGVAGKEEEGTVHLQYMPFYFFSLELQTF